VVYDERSDTKAAEEENAPKPPSILPEKIDMGIWAIQGRCFEVMKSSGSDATTDFCKSAIQEKAPSSSA
jgi:hypothetical protein